MSVVRIGGGLVDDGYSDPDPADRFRAAPVVSPEELAAEQRSGRIWALVEPFETAEPPTSADLGIKDDLPPARQLVARFIGWIALLEKQRSDLQRGRGALLSRLGVPAETEQQLVEMEAEDRTGLMAWLRSGAKQALPKLAREFEHQQLAAKLTSDTYQAGIARDALTQAEEQIDMLAGQLTVLQQRKAAAAKLTLIEHANSAGARYAASVKATEDALAPLMGLASLLEDRDFYSADATVRTLLPSFGLSSVPGNVDAVSGQYGPLHGSTRVTVDERRVSKEAEPWRRLLELWLTDPRAKPPAGT
jgi:hypothetical protein